MHMAVRNIFDLMGHLILMVSQYHYVLDLVNGFFSIAVKPDDKEQFVFTWEFRQWIFQVLVQAI